MQCDNTTGACPGKCASGWFGPACQYVSAKFLASPSDRFKGCNMTYLEDTDDTTCDTTRTVFLKMDEALPVTWLRLIGDDAEQLSQITIAGWSSYNVIKVDGKTVDFFRSPHGISISTNIYFSSVSSFMLCSIYISRGRNVALSRETTQSSSYLSWRAFRGVDSDTNTCTHTHNALKPAYWSLIFLQPTSVFGVRIYNRVDCCSNRLIGFTLRLIDKQHRSVYEYTDTNKTASAVYSLPFKGVPSAPVQFLNISKSLKSEYLTVCEVIVYGDSVCPSGTFGRECERKCNCDHKQEPCFVSTGGCPSGCALGYTGEDCWKAPIVDYTVTQELEIVNGILACRNSRGTSGIFTSRISRQVSGILTTRDSRQANGILIPKISRQVSGILTTRNSRQVSGILTTRNSRQANGILIPRNSRQANGILTTRNSRHELETSQWDIYNQELETSQWDIDNQELEKNQWDIDNQELETSQWDIDNQELETSQWNIDTWELETSLSVSLDKVGFVKKGALSGQSSQTPTYIGVGVALTALAVLTVLVALVLLKRKRRSSTSEGGGGIKFTSMEE
ncbi:receptor-type tyrosine-protein phosphatase kappa-like [Plakobranchus ocellatus]|uniref:Receptor-type tyrosine-protein phosphatase kappa-like n=1 Tax=Plakobranchus ocellatus TaxID=259542 RepID=A0AAV4C0I7_9GAST|nr:receptor-type tyrosine-protein phosphatase kappa-like [Plakobranchus ocellatus]